MPRKIGDGEILSRKLGTMGIALDSWNWLKGLPAKLKASLAGGSQHEAATGQTLPKPPAQRIAYTATRVMPVDIAALTYNRVLTGEVTPAIAENYKLLRTQILQKTRAAKRNVLMFVSPLPGDGKTLTAINLAISLSQDVAPTVLLVDLDLRAPSVHRYFGLPGDRGLVDYLENGVDLAELLIHPQGFDKLVILPAGRPTPWAAEFIRSPRMQALVQELKERYPDRYVLFDLPPLLSYADALAFAPLSDGIIMVVKARQTSREDLMRCQEMLRDFPILGYVLNEVDFVKEDRYYRRNGRPGQKQGFY